MQPTESIRGIVFQFRRYARQISGKNIIPAET